MRTWIEIAAFAGLTALVSVACSVWFDHAERPGSWERQTDAQYAGLAVPPRVLVLGDSHAKCGVDPAWLENAFNYASLGGQYHQIYPRLRALLDEAGPPPELVLLPADTHSLAWQPARFEESAYWSKRLNYVPLLRYSGRPGHFIRHAVSGGLVPYRGQGDRMVTWLAGRSTQRLPFPMLDGHVAMDGDWSQVPPDERRERATAQAAFLHAEYEVVHPLSLYFFEKTLALCRDRGIRVALVRYPLAVEAWESIDAAMDIEALDRIFAETATRYGDYLWLDFGWTFETELNLFNDSDHLNAAGAHAFTQRLAERIRADMGAR